MLTKRQRQILEIMVDHFDDEDGEIVYERGAAYLGNTRIAARTVFALLRLCAISLQEDSRIGQYERYVINETGRRLLSAVLDAQEKPQ